MNMKTEQTTTLEKGNIYFFYRPRVEEEDPGGKSDVRNLYMVLCSKDKHARLGILGQKEMPDPEKSGHNRYWGFIDLVRKDPKAIRDALASEEYETKTRGKRHQPAARPAGEGVYRILRHEDHTHLAYRLELPKSPGEVQDELGIEEQASYVISVKNPEKGSPRAAGLSEDRKADFPKKLQEKFRDRKFIDADPPDFLNHEGCEFVLISASEDLKEDLGIELKVEDEDKSSADIFNQLKADKLEAPTEPLFEGKWE